MSKRLESIFGWIIFLVTLVWFYRIPPWRWTTYLPGSGDVLEALWQTNFWRDMLISGSFQLVSPVAFYPLGMHQMVLAHVGTGLLLLPVSMIVGGIAAINVGSVAGLVLCFLGARTFLKYFTPSPLLASIGATILTFALGRTFHIHAHLNVALASAAGIWMAAMLMELRQRPSERRAWIWAIGSGICWGIAIIAQPYFIFLASVLLVLPGTQRQAWKYVPLVGISTIVTSGLLLLGVAQGTSYMISKGTSLQALTAFSATPGSYLGWSRLSVWKEPASLTAGWRRNFSEADIQNWGVLSAILAASGVILTWRAKSNRMLTGLLIITSILSFGPLWRDSPLHGDLSRQTNEWIWQLGAVLKPELFSDFSASLKGDSVPLPGMLPVLLIPRYEFARVAGRYSIWVGLTVAALGLITLSRLPHKWAIVLGCLWMIELLPVPRQPQLAPIQPHPAHEWASAQVAGQDAAVFSPPGMEFIYSHYLAGNLPGANANGPFPPAYMRYTYPWITYRNPAMDPLPEALVDPVHVAILRRAQVRIVLLRPEAASMAKQNSALRFAGCFEPDPDLSYYHSPLCAFEVLPYTDDFFSIQPLSGFSDFEADGVWVEGTRAQAGWRTTYPATTTIDIGLRAYCPEQNKQSVVIRLNNQIVASHQWDFSCWERWDTTLTISPDQLRAGLNVITFEASLAAQPFLYDPENKDRRSLSIMVERLRVSTSVTDQR